MSKSLKLLGVATLLSSLAVFAQASSASAADCGYLFDDFSYSSSADSSLTAHGWTPRSYAGGPGVPGATWSPNSITFPTADGQKVMDFSAGMPTLIHCGPPPGRRATSGSRPGTVVLLMPPLPPSSGTPRSRRT